MRRRYRGALAAQGPNPAQGTALLGYCLHPREAQITSNSNTVTLNINIWTHSNRPAAPNFFYYYYV